MPVKDDMTVVSWDPAWRTYQVAKLRFEDGLSPGQIADKLHLNHSSVSRILKRAIDDGIVEVRRPKGEPIPPQLGARELRELRTALKDAYALRTAIVVDVPKEYFGKDGFVWSYDDALHERLGAVGAAYLTGTVRDGDTLACGGGRAVHALARDIRRRNLLLAERLTVLSLAGGTAIHRYEEKGEDVVISANATAAMLGRAAWPSEVVTQPGPGYKRPGFEDRRFTFAVDDRGPVHPKLAIVGVGAIARGYPHCFEALRPELDPEGASIVAQMETEVNTILSNLEARKIRPKDTLYFPLGDILTVPFIVNPPHEIEKMICSRDPEQPLPDDPTLREAVKKLDDDLVKKISPKVLAAKEDLLRRIDECIILAGGARKVWPLRHALLRVLMTRKQPERHTLVTDIWTARDLLAIAAD